jgi:dihydrofolate synthase / folylpolyglutamate synthase
VLPLTAMLSYEEALDYLYSFVDYGAVRPAQYSAETFDLGRMVRLMADLGDPHRRYPALHIAGTKGKGSVAAMCASALRAGGYRTGFYTSPHLLEFGERIQVDGEHIPRAAVAELVEVLREAAPRHQGITTFELTTALAFLYFAQAQVDVAVLEVGLGGRLDATNIVTPRVSVITSLSYDHQSLLGHTLAEIAGEKGGIIKPGVPVVVAPQPPEALEVLARIAAERGAPLTLVGRDWHYRPVAHALDGQTFEVWSARERTQLEALWAEGHGLAWRPERLEIPLLGVHQVENGAVAYAALQALREQGLPLAPGAVREGLKAVRWPGRFEVLSRQPALVVDGAHNADSAEKLAQAVRAYFPGRPVTLVFGASSDKDVAGMLRALLRPEVGVRRAVFTQAVHPRAQASDELAALANAVAGDSLSVETAPTVADGVAAAWHAAGPEDVIVATGSLFIVAEARAVALNALPAAKSI